MHRLPKISIIAQNLVVQLVERILYTGTQIRRHLTARIRETILTAHDGGYVLWLTIGIRIVIGAEITLTRRVLKRDVWCHTMPIVSRVIVPTKATGINIVFELLCEGRLVRLQRINSIATTAKLGSVMILKRYFWINACLEDTWVSSNVNNARWSAYYLNLQRIIDVCWEAGSLVGPGRGSGVGFILLYCLTWNIFILKEGFV